MLQNVRKTKAGVKRIAGGAVLIFMGCIGFSACIDNGFSVPDAVLATMFFAGGVTMVYFGMKAKSLFSRFRKYLYFIYQEETSLDKISSVSRIPYMTVVSDLNKVIDKGYLKNCYVDEDNRKISLPIQNTNSRNATANEQKNQTAKCVNCGAVNTLINGAGACEYCGSPLNGKS